MAGERGVGVGEFQQADGRVSEGEAEGGEQLVEWRGSAQGVQLTHGGDIERTGEGAAQGDRAAVGVVIVFRQIEALRGAERAGDIGKDGGGDAVVVDEDGC